MAGMGLPADMFVPHCLSIYMCDAPAHRRRRRAYRLRRPRARQRC